MNISKINQNCAFKALVIHPYKKEYTEKFLKQYEDVVAKAAKDNDLYISAEDKTFKTGPDYVISRPAINVSIHPTEVSDEKGHTEFDRNYNTVICTAFSYLPTLKNEKEGKFAQVLQQSLSLIG